MHKKYLFVSTIIAIAALSALTGCGKGSDSTPATAQTVEKSSSANSAQEELRKKEEQALQVLEKARKEKAATRYKEALELFTQAIELAPHIGMPGLIFVERGETYQSLGMLKDALSDYTRAIQMNPDKTFRLRRIAVANALGASSEIKEDIEALEACCASDKDVKQIKLNLKK